MSYVEGAEVVNKAKRRLGAPYLYGAERAKFDHPMRPIDCSELVQMAFAEVGLKIADGAANQWTECRPCSIEQAGNIPGALLFWKKNSLARISHVAISTGEHNTIEATPPKVVVRPITARKWSCAGLPKVIYG